MRAARRRNSSRAARDRAGKRQAWTLALHETAGGSPNYFRLISQPPVKGAATPTVTCPRPALDVLGWHVLYVVRIGQPAPASLGTRLAAILRPVTSHYIHACVVCAVGHSTVTFSPDFGGCRLALLEPRPAQASVRDSRSSCCHRNSASPRALSRPLSFGAPPRCPCQLVPCPRAPMAPRRLTSVCSRARLCFCPKTSNSYAVKMGGMMGGCTPLP